MKAVLCKQYGPPDSLVLEDVPSPKPDAGQVLISVKAAGVNFPDVLIIQNKYQFRPPLPFSPGGEVAGLVKELGAGVTNVKVGDRVIGSTGWGGFAEEAVAPAARCIPFPSNIGFVEASAFVMTYGTSHHALKDRAKLKAGETLLVLGAAGGVGIAAVQIGKLMGARVIAAASTAEKRAFAVRFGADHTIDYTRTGWRDTLKELTGGHGPDVIFDPVGGELALQAFRSIAWRGRHLVVGFASGTIPALAFNLPLLKGGALLGVDLAQIQKREPETHTRLMAQLFDWLASGKLQPVVGKVVPFENFREAFKTMQSRSALGKMIVKFG
jgi:NADPH2:quinone reductase